VIDRNSTQTGDVIVEIKVKPASREDVVELLAGNTIRVKVREIPERGRANKAVIELLAREMKIPKSSIKLESGLKSRNKRLLLIGGKRAYERFLRLRGATD